MDGEFIILSSAALGFFCSLITEVIKRIPWFGETKRRKRVLAFAVSVIATASYAIIDGSLNGLETFPALILVILSSFGTYQSFIKMFYSEEE